MKLHWSMGVLGCVRWLTLTCLLAGAASSALAVKTYSDNGDGTVTDPTTGLQWMRCSMGQTWDGAAETCGGAASTYSFDESNGLKFTFAGQSDMRLPNIRELQTIVDRSRYNPAIDPAVFPNTSASWYWSATADASLSIYSWWVRFDYGNAGSNDNRNSFQVRLVRAGQSISLLDIARPSTDYVDHGDGTLTHTPTGLIWQRCALGQTLTGSTCSGSSSAYGWANALLLSSNFAGQNDWRLPTQEELLSLLDYGRFLPAINTALFPNVPASYFWSASADAGNSGRAWMVGFGNGAASYEVKGYTENARLVRAGQSFGSFALNIAKTGPGDVTSGGLAGIDCGDACTGSYTAGTRIILNAKPASGLVAWGGDCLSAGTAATCTVTMDAIKDVSASFADIPVISGLPATLTFAAQNMGSTSAAQHATLTNTATAALVVSTITATGDYSVTHNCLPGPVAAGASCTLNISFTPSASGSRTGSITVNSNAPGSAPSIALSGTGLGGVLSLSTSALSFSGQNTGTTSVAKGVTLSNIGGAGINNLTGL